MAADQMAEPRAFIETMATCRPARPVAHLRYPDYYALVLAPALVRATVARTGCWGVLANDYLDDLRLPRAGVSDRPPQGGPRAEEQMATNERALDEQDIELLLTAVRHWEASAADEAEQWHDQRERVIRRAGQLLGALTPTEADSLQEEYDEWQAREIRNREERSVLLRAKLIRLRDQQHAEQLAHDLTRGSEHD